MTCIWQFISEKNISFKYSALVLLLGSFYLFHVFSLIYSANLKAGLFDIEVKSTLLIFPLIFSVTKKLEKSSLLKILKAFIFGAFICVGIALIRAVTLYQSGNNYINFYYSELAFHMHPGYLSIYINFALALAYYLLLFEIKEIKYKIGLMFLVLIFSVFIMLLSAKMGIITSLFLHLFILLYILISKKNLVTTSIIAGCFLISVPILYKIAPFPFIRFYDAIIVTINPQTDKASSESTSIRIFIWKSAIEMIKDNFVLGTGAGDVKDELVKQYKKDGIITAYNIKLNTHNQFLQSFAALGVIGFALLIFLLLIPFGYSLLHKNFPAIAFLLIIICNFLVESVIEVQAGVLFFSFFYSLMFINKGFNNKEVKQIV